MSIRKVAVIGLGYVGLPVAAAFAKKQQVIAFDINQKRIVALREGQDHTGEVGASDLQQGQFVFTHEPEDLKQADFYIIAVPTPIDEANQPDLSPLLSASKTIAPHLKKGDIVVYESTVYPGTTEEDCVPALEHYSGLKCGIDFFVGYSPERINPGDKEHTFTKIRKIVSGQTPAVLEIVANVYGRVVEAGVYKASSIKVAEAAKVIENTQRDLNIAFVNELSMIFHKLEIDTLEVLEAAGTKWNFLPFRPGLVGGHCIGVDPYYLTHKAESMGYHPQVILAGRRVNDGMGAYIAQQAIKQLASKNVALAKARIGILGLSFKENCPDLRNTKVVDIIAELKEYGVQVVVHDPLGDAAEAYHEYGLELSALEAFHDLDILILAVAHQEYRQLTQKDFANMLKVDSKIILDVKAVLNPQEFKAAGFNLWRL
jgi:UDP-N-acetyl-D-galactosamine dehydrogenase